MNRVTDKDKIADRELRRNGSGYMDLTAYKAIKRADKDKEKRPMKNRRQRGYYVGPYEEPRKVPLKRYIKGKQQILDDLCIEMTEAEREYMKSLKTEAAVDAYAHKLIMRKD